jgi:hypothetical protein
MALSSTTVIDKVEVLENGVLQVRQAEVIANDGVELTRTFHRFTLAPTDSTTGQDPKVIAIANAVWTQEVVTAYQAQLASQNKV